MTKDGYINGPPDPEFDPTGASKEAIRREFARRLQFEMTERGWTQSELARRANQVGPTRIGRDDISTYVRAVSIPGPQKIRQIAAALGVAIDALIPAAHKSVERDLPEFDMRTSGDGQVWVRMNRRVSWEQAKKIMDILSEEQTAP